VNNHEPSITELVCGILTLAALLITLLAIIALYQ